VTLQQITERLNRLTDAFLDGTVEKNIYEERKTALLREKRSTEDQLNRLKDPRASVPDTVQKFLELAGSTYSLYKTAMIEKKRRILQIVTSNFAVCSGTLDFAYAIPFNEVAERENNTDGRPRKVIHRTLDKLVTSLVSQLEALSHLVLAFAPVSESEESSEESGGDEFTYVPIKPDEGSLGTVLY